MWRSTRRHVNGKPHDMAISRHLSTRYCANQAAYRWISLPGRSLPRQFGTERRTYRPEKASESAELSRRAAPHACGCAAICACYGQHL